MNNIQHLSDVATVTMGTSPKGTSYNNEGDGIPLLNGPTEFGPSHPDCTLFTTASKKECEKGDLIFCVRGSTTGRMNWADKVYSLGRGVCSIRGETPLDTKFLKYCIQCNLDALLMLAGGATMPNLTQDTIKSFTIPFPGTRHKIASILSTYDDLIENNTRRIAILEEMAQAIYREWFVHFRFPGHENVKLVDSPLGQIPEGWEVKKLGDAIELPYGKALKKADRKGGDVAVYGSGGIVGYHDEFLSAGPGIVVGRKGNVGSVFWSDVSFYPIDTAFYVKTDLPLHYVYFNLLLSQQFLNSDAAVPGLNRNQAYSNPFLIPENDLLNSFTQQIAPIFSLTRSLRSRNENLRTTRDLLLPKLISGKLDVEDLDIDIGLNTEALQEPTA